MTCKSQILRYLKDIEVRENGMLHGTREAFVKCAVEESGFGMIVFQNFTIHFIQACKDG